MRRLIPIVSVLAVVALTTWILIGLMPRGYETDLARIGQGRPAAVLVHDAQYVASLELMESVNRLRDDFEPKVLFLLADLQVPHGRRFAAAHSANFDALVLFDADGRRIAVHSGDTSEAAVHAFLNKHYP